MVLARMRAFLHWKQRIHTCSLSSWVPLPYILSATPREAVIPIYPQALLKMQLWYVSQDTREENVYEWVTSQALCEVLSLGKQAHPAATASPLENPVSRRWPSRLLPSVSMCSAAHSRSTLYGPWTAGRRLLCPWEFLSKNAGVVDISFSRGSS